MATRRYGTIVRHLADDPATAGELAAKLPDDVLHHLAEALRDEARRRAIGEGDHTALIDETFETAFGGDGLGVDPWIEGQLIVCPGAMVAKSRSNHRCRFVSVDDAWIWESSELLEETKRSIPGTDDGFRAVALLPIVNGMTLDVVTGRARTGQHTVDAVTSYVVRRGKLVEIGRRKVSGRGMK